MRRQSFYVAGAIGVVVLSACSKKPQECKQIIGIIDDDDQQVEVAAAGRGPDPSQNAKAATDLAAAEDKIVADLSALTITTVDLKKGSDDYVAAAKDASTALKKVAAPLMKFAGSMSAGTDPYSRLDGSKAKIIQRCAPSPASHEAIL